MNPDLPHTEESLQLTLSQLSAARQTGDDAAAGQALLQLAYLVKWVRSDNDQPPFERSHTLALEARELFLQRADPCGEAAALVLAAPFEPPESADTMLLRAQSLADASGDDLLRARVIAARGRHLALHDRTAALGLTNQALALFRQLNHPRGIATCLLSASLATDDPAQKLASARKCAPLFRSLGMHSKAAMVMIIAISAVEYFSSDPAQLAPLEPDILLTLQDAQFIANRPLQGRCYGYLAQVATARGDTQAAENFRKLERAFQEALQP